MIRRYYELTKPGIVYGNTFTTIAAFLFAARYQISLTHFFALLLATVLGIAFVIASACVFNNVLDRDIDAKMARTKERALVRGDISIRSALWYATILGLAGLPTLYLGVNILTAGIALFGFVMYIVYTFAKRKGEWGVLVGSIPGAVAILVGYTAVTNQIDATAGILFLIMVLWQMPHFYAISLYRLSDYVSAGIPILPVARGVFVTKVHMVGYIISYIVAVSLLTLTGATGYIYLGIVLLFGLIWLYLGLSGFKAPDTTVWARRVFLFSLIVLVTFCISIAIAPLLP